MQSWQWPAKTNCLIDFFGPHFHVLVVKKGGNNSTSLTPVLEFGLMEPNETCCHWAIAIGKALVMEHGEMTASYGWPSWGVDHTSHLKHHPSTSPIVTVWFFVIEESIKIYLKPIKTTWNITTCNRLDLETHNIIHIHNNVMRGWQYSTKYSSHLDRMWRIFCMKNRQSRKTMLWIWTMLCTKILPNYAQKSPGTLALIGGGGEGIVKNLNWIRGRQQQLRWKHLIRALVGGA
jgi:hypothetical protein